MYKVNLNLFRQTPQALAQEGALGHDFLRISA